MQINSASSYTPQTSSSLPVDSQNQVVEQRDRLRVQQSTEQVEQSNKLNTQQTQEKNKQSSQVERFDVDAKALALVEQAQTSSNSLQTPSQGSNAFSQQSNNQSSSKASYDSPSKQNQTAIAAYSSVDSISQRENIQQVFGIDLLV
jgi:hypothetical protein